MNKLIVKIKFFLSLGGLAAISCLIFALSACSGRIMGHSLVLWSLPEKEISDGDLVPVYIRSNINKVYVIGVPGTKEKIEVPLWQITEPESKRKAGKHAKLYAEFRHIYASVKLDGLPMRAEAINTGKQVYRLRKNEIVKVLYKGKGQLVMTGSSPLEGDWLYVLAKEGTQGWCFSYNLELFDESSGAAPIEEVQERDELLEIALEQIWYPESYGAMVSSKKIDLSQMKENYGFDPGLLSGRVRLTLADVDLSYPYAGVTKTNANVYSINNTPLTMTIRRPDFLALQYVNESGLPVSFSFITINSAEKEIPEEKTSKNVIARLIQEEKDRRQKQYHTVMAFGPVFSSSNYGTLQLFEEGTFIWTGLQLLVNSGIIPAVKSNKGSVSIKYFADEKIASLFDGVLSFIFDEAAEEVNFLYKIENNGLRLENIDKSAIGRGNRIMALSRNPLVLFFAVDNSVQP